MLKKTIATLMFILLFLSSSAIFSEAAEFNPKTSRWSKEIIRKNSLGARLSVRATFYTGEFIEQLLKSEAQKNMWTEAELEDYRYNFLKNLQLEKFIPIYLEIENNGPTAHMAPFHEMVSLTIGKKSYAPVEYEQRFNLPLQGKRDGMVFFSRYNEKTGKSLLLGNKHIKFTLRSVVFPVIEGKSDLAFIWDIAGDDTEKMYDGKASSRLELDRLIKRLEKLSREKKDLEMALSEKNKELKEINDRVEELQKK